MLPQMAPSYPKGLAQAMIPMWDSSDPARNPPPLPLRPHGPGSPIASSIGPAATLEIGYESPPSSSREASPVRRPRSDSFGPNNINNNNNTAPMDHPKRTPMPSTPGGGHKRTNSNAPSPSVREMHNVFLGGGRSETSPTRGATPTPRELFGSNATFPIKDREILQPREQYSSLSFRKSLDFEKVPTLTPLRSTKTPEPTVPNSNALIRASSSGDTDDPSPKVTAHDIHAISTQLAGITTIATSLQREMTNLSRRSKDNATDLMALKEAAKNRDEDIRRSLRDLQAGLTSFDATDRLLEGRHSHLSLNAPSISSGSDRGSDCGDNGALVSTKFAAASTQALEKILREMPSKDEQERALVILQDIQESLKSHERKEDQADAQKKILSVLEEIRDKEESRGKEVALIGSRAEDDDIRVLAMLEGLRQELHPDKSGEEKIISILEEIREKEVDDRSDERILSAIDELKELNVKVEGDERLDRIVSMLEELRDREEDEKVISMLEEVRVKLEIMSEDLAVRQMPTVSSTPTPREPENIPLPPDSDDVLEILKLLEEGVNTGGALSKEIKGMVEDWKEIWTGHDKTVGDALKDLGGQIEVLAAVQRAAMARMPVYGALGLPSQALTTTNPPLPPDLDNEAAITALANIASTTTRTDITLSSINALIKVFQKESYHANTNNTEGLASLGRFLEEIGQGVGNANAQVGDIRKVLEVVRTGVCSGNDRLVGFEGRASRQIDELKKIIMGDDEEALWKVDLGVKDDVEELTRKVDDFVAKNAEALNSASEKTLEAITKSSPTMLIEELKSALGAMAQRSLDAFKNSEEAIHQLREETSSNAEAIKNASSAIAIANFRVEAKEMAEKTYAICETIDAKCGSDEVKDILSTMKQELSNFIKQSASSASAEAADLKAAIDKLREELDAKMEDSLTTAVALASADEKTTTALAEFKAEMSETLSKAVVLAEKDDSSKILEPIRELRQEMLAMIEKSNSALAAPVKYPEADDIKLRIERLYRDLMDAMEKTADLVGETAMSNGASGQQMMRNVETLRKDIGVMGSSIAAAVASNSAAAMEEGINVAFEDMKETVLAKVEQSLITSDKAVSCIADLSQQTRDSINDLKREVIEMMNKSISLAVATVKPDDTDAKNRVLLNTLEGKITDIIISTMAASSSSDEIKEMIEGLKADIDGMGKLMATPTPGSDETIKRLLCDMKKDITSIVSTALSSQETKQSVEDLRREVREMMDKSSSMIAPMRMAPSAPSVSPARLEAVIATLKEDVNDLVEKSLAAALASSTFDSEGKVREALEELKRDVRDTLEKSMVPLPQQANTESSRMVREAMEVLRQELSTMFEKRAVGESEDREQMMSRLDALKGQFGELLEKSTNVEVKEAVDVLKIQVYGLLERSSGGAEYAELKDMLKALTGQVIVREPMPADDEVNVILEAVRGQVEELAVKITEADVKQTVEALKVRMDELASKPVVVTDNSELKAAIESLQSQIQKLHSKPSEDVPSRASTTKELKQVMDSFKSELEKTVEEATRKLSKADDVLAVKELMEDFKVEILAASTGLGSADALEELKSHLQGVLEKIVAPLTAEQAVLVDDTHMREVKEVVEQLRRDVRDMLTKPGHKFVPATSTPKFVPHLIPESLDLKETVADIHSAVGECRVEVAIVKALLEEKSGETSGSITGIAKTMGQSHAQSREAISAVRGAVAGVRDVVDDIRAASKESITGVREILDGLQTSTAGAIATANKAISDFRADARDRVAEVKTVVDSIKEETKDGFEEVNKTVESAQVEVKEVVTALDRKINTVQDDIKGAVSDVRAIVGESKGETQASIDILAATIDTSHAEAKEEIAVVKKLVEDSHCISEAEHDKTQKQVAEVLSLVDDLQTEWKGHQPTLFDALLEMKQLLLEAQEAQKVAASKPEIELPPSYDDSKAQDKLDQLIAGTAVQTKYLPQLDLLDTIQKQVSATATSISDFIEQQKLQAAEDAAAKIEAARQAELDLERAITEKRLVEAATERLRDEHDKLQVAVEMLQEETEELRERKLGVAAELAGFETALLIRREEMVMLEARSESLERRMLDSIMEQSRSLLKPKSPTPTPSPVKQKITLGAPAVGAERRHFSHSQVGADMPNSPAPRRGGLGLGQKEYSAALGLVGRSNSLKQVSYAAGRRKGSVGSVKAQSQPLAQLQTLQQPVVDEEDVGLEGVVGYESDEEEGSVIRVPEAGVRKKKRGAYPGLSLDFGDVEEEGGREEGRSVSGVSSMA